jgi:hypothetical protein
VIYELINAGRIRLNPVEGETTQIYDSLKTDNLASEGSINLILEGEKDQETIYKPKEDMHVAITKDLPILPNIWKVMQEGTGPQSYAATAVIFPEIYKF